MRIVIAEDAVLLREGLVHILTRFGHEVAAAVDNAPALLAAVAEHQPDIAIIDVRLPPGFRDEGLRAAIQLRREHSATAILVLSQHVEHLSATELLDTAPTAVGYLLKDRVGDIEEFLDAIERVAARGTVIDPEVVRQLIARRRDDGPLGRLTPREQEVLALMAEGHANRAIADHLVVTEAAIAKHINSILTKLDLPPETDGHRRVLAVLAYLQRDDTAVQIHRRNR